MNGLNALGCLVFAFFVGGVIATVPALGIVYFAGEEASDAAAATMLIVTLVSAAVVFRWARRLSVKPVASQNG